MMTNNLELFKKAKCSAKGKKTIFETVNRLLNFAEKAKREGSLSLQNDLEDIDSFLLRTGLELIINGHDLKSIKLILNNYLYSSKLSGKELLESMIIVEGVLSIKNDDNYYILKDKIASYFGENFRKTFKEYFEIEIDVNSFEKCQETNPDDIDSNMNYPIDTKIEEGLNSLIFDKDLEIVEKLNKVFKKYNRIIADNEISQEEIDAISDILTDEKCRATLGLLLRDMEKDYSDSLIENLRIKNPDLITTITDHLFVFEDIALLDDRSIQKLLREVDQLKLAKALKGASKKVYKKITRNMSNRAAQLLLEDIEFMGPVLLDDVKKSQRNVVDLVFKLGNAGEIIINNSKRKYIF